MSFIENKKPLPGHVIEIRLSVRVDKKAKLTSFSPQHLQRLLSFEHVPLVKVQQLTGPAHQKNLLARSRVDLQLVRETLVASEHEPIHGVHHMQVSVVEPVVLCRVAFELLDMRGHVEGRQHVSRLSKEADVLQLPVVLVDLVCGL